MKRIAFLFDHPPCPGVTVEITVPLPDPLPQLGAQAMATPYLPACPLCKERTRYAGFHFDDTDREG